MTPASSRILLLPDFRTMRDDLMRSRRAATKSCIYPRQMLTLTFALVLCVLSSALAVRPHIYLIRGGGDDGRSPIELNRNWVPPSSRQGRIYNERRDQSEVWVETQTFADSYVTLGDLEKRSHEQRSHGKASLVDYVKRYATELHRNNPSLYFSALGCAVVFIMWQIKSLTPFLMNYFVCSRRNLLSGRLPSVLLSAISHADFMHLAMNLFGLLRFGPKVQAILARRNWPIWPLLSGAAITGSAMFLLFGDRRGSCFGLSGVTLSLLAMEARLFPQRQLGLVIGVFPVRMPAEILLQVLLVWSVLGTFSRRSKVAHQTHLGGLLFGMAYYELWRSNVSWKQFPKHCLTSFKRSVQRKF